MTRRAGVKLITRSRVGWVVMVAAWTLGHVIVPPVAMAQIMSNIQADLYLAEGALYIRDGDYRSAYETIAQIRGLEGRDGFRVSDRYYFKYGQVLLMAGEFDEAQIALYEYLRIARPEGEYYNDAIEMLAELVVGSKRGDGDSLSKEEAKEAAAYNAAVFLDSVEAYEEYLQDYSDGPYATDARTRRSEAQARVERNRDEKERMEDDEAYRVAVEDDRVEAYDKYLQDYPDGRHATDARVRRSEAQARVERNRDEKERMEDDEAYRVAVEDDRVEAYDKYLQDYPDGRHATDARVRRSEAHARAGQNRDEEARMEDDEAYRVAVEDDRVEAYEGYLTSYPDGRHVEDVIRRRADAYARDDAAYKSALLRGAAAAFDRYLTEYPDGIHAAELRYLMPGRHFRDCPECPKMVIVPTGSYVMGSPASEEGRYENEGPQRHVTIEEHLAVGVYETTNKEFARFAMSEQYQPEPGCWTYETSNADGADKTEMKFEESRDWMAPEYMDKRPDDRMDDDPVTCVNWYDAKAYVQWLSLQSKHRYRLLTEAEWEYVARAGAVGRYVGSENAFGLFHLQDNVWEWVEDCWNDSYESAPQDGSAWLNDDCGRRVLRGGSWLDEKEAVRLASRGRNDAHLRANFNGFRVVRVLYAEDAQ